VTYILDGGFDHGDSRGNKGRYGPGDVQWLTTGSGVLHSEMFVTKKKEISYFDGFQLWLNLPKKDKMVTPSYQMLWKKDIPVAKVPGGPGGLVEVVIIAGQIDTVKSTVEKSVPLSYLHVKLPPKTSFAYPAPQDHNAFLYVKEGHVCVGEKDKKIKMESAQYAVLAHDGEQFQVYNDSEDTPAELLFFEGKPHNEPFAHRGPFVMNTDEEIMQANRDFRAGKFGNMEDAWVQPFEDDDE
jgi:quercetin 2,3-dioxygenase